MVDTHIHTYDFSKINPPEINSVIISNWLRKSIAKPLETSLISTISYYYGICFSNPPDTNLIISNWLKKLNINTFETHLNQIIDYYVGIAGPKSNIFFNYIQSIINDNFDIYDAVSFDIYDATDINKIQINSRYIYDNGGESYWGNDKKYEIKSTLTLYPNGFYEYQRTKEEYPRRKGHEYHCGIYKWRKEKATEIELYSDEDMEQGWFEYECEHLMRVTINSIHPIQHVFDIDEVDTFDLKCWEGKVFGGNKTSGGFEEYNITSVCVDMIKDIEYY